nr:oligopeptide transporter 1-like [Ipomoea batatas]
MENTGISAVESSADEINDSPIEEVRLTVPITDDPTMPCVTFRTWVLGVTSCVTLAFLNQFFGFRQNAIYVSSVSAQIVVLPIGKLMAAYLPIKVVQIPATKWSFSLNPGPFNIKEHVLITIFASSGSDSSFAMLGYGLAGIFKKFLIDSPYMWWPSNLVQVSLFRALHDVETRPKGGLTRLQFFITVLVCSFAYYVVPNYFFPSITALSLLCWIWKDSVTMQQLGSGLKGLGIGSFALDWATVAAFRGSPLATPAFAIINMLIGYILVAYIAIPVSYWTNLFDAKKFPIFSSHVFDSNGHVYNISRVLNKKTFEFDQQGYDSYNNIYLSTAFVYTYGLNFATLTATVSHVALFHGR